MADIPSSSKIAEMIFEQRSPNLPTGAIAEILDGLIWITADNGRGICKRLRRWIRSDDSAKAAEALELKNVFLWDTRQQILQDAEFLRDKHPALISKIEERLSAWDRSHQLPENRGQQVGADLYED